MIEVRSAWLLPRVVVPSVRKGRRFLTEAPSALPSIFHPVGSCLKGVWISGIHKPDLVLAKAVSCLTLNGKTFLILSGNGNSLGYR